MGRTCLFSLLGAHQVAGTPPGGIAAVFKDLGLKVVSNPVKARTEANFIGILARVIALGAALRHASPAKRAMLPDGAAVLPGTVRRVIRVAPLGLFGLIDQGPRR